MTRQEARLSVVAETTFPAEAVENGSFLNSSKKKIEDYGTLQNSFYNASITLYQSQTWTLQENYRPI